MKWWNRNPISSSLAFSWSEVITTPPLHLSSQVREGGIGRYRSHSWGESFSELQPYQQGDSNRHIHWPTYVNRGELVVKRFDLPMCGELCLLLDGTASMVAGTRWHHAQELAARLCVGALRAGHRVQIIYDHNGVLREGPLLKRLEDLPTIWSSLIAPPSGDSSSLLQRQVILSRLRASTTLVYMTDGIVTTKAERLESSTRSDHERKEERLLGVEEQLSGALGRLERIIYVCLTDKIADRPPVGISLCSPESESTATSKYQSLSRAEAEDLWRVIKTYRAKQEDLFIEFHRTKWLSFEVTLDSIKECLIRLQNALK